MAFIPVNLVAEVEMRYLWDAQRVENTLYFHSNPAVDLDTALMDALGLYMVTWFDDHLSNYLCTDISLQEVYITELTNDTAPTVSYVTGLPLPGLVAEDSCPNNDGVCVSFRTAGRGRSARGRNYVPGMRKTQLTNSTWDTSYVDGIAGVYDLLRTAGPDNWAWGVVSRYHNNAPRSTGLFQAITAALVVDYVVDSQRRRLPGRGT